MKHWSALVIGMALSACGGGTEDAAAPVSGDSIAITATGPTAPVPAGSTARFELLIRNPGTVTASNATLNLALGAGLTQVSASCVASNGAACPAQPDNLLIQSLPAGGVLQLSVDVRLAADQRGSVSSLLSVAASGDTNTANNSVEVIISSYRADLRVTSTASSTEFPSGSTGSYESVVANMGPDTARNLTVQTGLGAGQTLTAITCTAEGGAVCPSVLAATMTVPELVNGGQLIFAVRASIDALLIGSVSHTLHVSAGGDPDSSNNVATSSARARIPVSPQSSSFVALRSDVGDYIGGGRTYGYDARNARLNVTASGGLLSVRITGDQTWSGDFQLPVSATELRTGSYTDLRRYPFHNAVFGGLSWYGDGRGCNTLSGSFTISNVVYTAGSLSSVSLDFEQHCESAGPALRGQIHWNASDGLTPPGPVNPPPATLWSPPAGSTPATGNYIYLQSDAGDYIGAGRSYTYTQANAVLNVIQSGNQLTASVGGNQSWGGTFRAMDSISTLAPGYYPNLRRHPFHNPVVGGLDWSGDGRGCNTLTGWFVVDNISFAAGQLASIDLRFEQHCEGASPALRGKIHWIRGDTTQPSGPVQPPPTGLWEPSPGTTPASGNYVYVQSATGDYIGQGRSYLYTPANALLGITANGSRLSLDVRGNENWNATFQGMNTLSQLQPGYYGNLQRYPFHNAVFGGLSFSGEGRGCNRLSGWFVVDSVTYSGGSLASIDLRFEQRCEETGPPLRGKIHWIR